MDFFSTNLYDILHETDPSTCVPMGQHVFLHKPRAEM